MPLDVSYKGQQAFHEQALDIFYSLASPPTHLLTNVHTGMGFQCLAQGVFDTNTLKPLALSDVGGEKLDNVPSNAQK